MSDIEVINNSYVFLKPVNSFDIDNTIIPFLKDCHYQNALLSEDLHVTICRAKQPILNYTKNSEIIEATITGAQVWHSPVTGKNNLVLTLESEQLVQRREKLLQNNEDMYPVYEPHLTLMYDMPNTKHTTRWWKNAIITKFNKGPEGKYFGSKIRLGNESIGNSIVKHGHKMSIATQPFNL